MPKILTLGESLVRLSSRHGSRLSDTAQLDLVYGGAEANVAANLAQFDNDVKYATKVPDNVLTNSLITKLKGYGVDTSQVIVGEPWERLGLYYLEVGAGLRPSAVTYDRKYSAIAMMETLEWDLDQLFADVEWFHITGVTLGLSKTWQRLGVQLIEAAVERGIKISFDMNYRALLWQHEEAREVYHQVLPHVDILNAGRLDAIHFMNSPEHKGDDAESWKFYAAHIANRYPNLSYVYGTNRQMLSPNKYRMNAFIWDNKHDEGYASQVYEIDEVVDRVGAGDSYAAGVIHSLAKGDSPLKSVEFGMAASALKHTVFGDVNSFSEAEIINFMNNKQNIIR